MKRIISLVLGIVMLLSLSVTAFAAEITGDSGSVDITYTYEAPADSYIVTIPDSMTIGTGATVSATDVAITAGYLLTVSVSSEQYSEGWKLVNGDDALGYTLKIDGADIQNNATVLTAKNGDSEVTKTLVTAISDTVTPKYSGSYTDTLTFSVSVAECEHTFDQTTGKCDCGEVATFVSTEEEMVAALEKGGTIMLTGDITGSDEYREGNVTKNTTIDLNGHTITGACVFSCRDNVVLTISGNGTIIGTYPFTYVIAGYSTLNILGGTIEGGTRIFGTTVMSGGRVDEMNTNKNDSDDDTSYITGGYVEKLNCCSGILKISGGHVEALGTVSGTIIISGGTFGFDPSAYVDTTTHTVTDNSDGTWTVTAN